MYTTTDLIIGVLLLVYLWDGLLKGLFRSLISPFAFLLFLIIGIIEFDLSDNLFKATFITVVGAAGLSTIIKIILFFSRRTVDSQYRNYSSWMSRLAGGIVSVLWKGWITAILILIIVHLPARTAGMSELQSSIRASQSYGYINQCLVKAGTRLYNVLATMDVLKDPGKAQELTGSGEIQEFLRASKTIEMVNDPDVHTALQAGDYFRLVSNPHVLAVLSDNHLMWLLTRFTKRLYTETSAAAQNNSPQ